MFRNNFTYHSYFYDDRTTKQFKEENKEAIDLLQNTLNTGLMKVNKLMFDLFSWQSSKFNGEELSKQNIAEYITTLPEANYLTEFMLGQILNKYDILKEGIKRNCDHCDDFHRLYDREAKPEINTYLTQLDLLDTESDFKNFAEYLTIQANLTEYSYTLSDIKPYINITGNIKLGSRGQEFTNNKSYFVENDCSILDDLNSHIVITPIQISNKLNFLYSNEMNSNLFFVDINEYIIRNIQHLLNTKQNKECIILINNIYKLVFDVTLRFHLHKDLYRYIYSLLGSRIFNSENNTKVSLVDFIKYLTCTKFFIGYINSDYSFETDNKNSTLLKCYNLDIDYVAYKETGKSGIQTIIELFLKDVEMACSYMSSPKALLQVLDKISDKVYNPSYTYKTFIAKCIKMQLEILRTSGLQSINSKRVLGKGFSNDVYISMNSKNIYSYGNESTCYNVVKNHLLEINKMNKDLNTKPSRYAFLGLESYSLENNSISKNDLMKSRNELLLDLNPKNKRLYLQLESDVLKLKSDIINVRDAKRLGSLIEKYKKLNIILHNYANTNDENFRVLLISLSSDINNEIKIASNRNFFKERNTMLFGHIKTLKDWDY